MRNLIDKVLSVFKRDEMVITKSEWSKLFAIAQESQMFGEKVTDPYRQVASVYKAIKAIADNVPQAERIFKDWSSEEEVYPKDLIRLFDRPNPLMNGSDFIQAVVGFYALKGEAFIVKTLSNGNIAGTSKIPAELWTFNPSKFTEVVDRSTGRLQGWKYGGGRLGSGQHTFMPDEVIHIKDFNPGSDYRGLAPTIPIANEIDIDWYSMVYSKAFFMNNATPDMVLSHDKTVPDKIKERIRAEWEKLHKGASKAHKMAILEGGVKAQILGSSHKDMDFIEQKKYMREETLGIWRAPKALFNITDDLNYATFMGQMKVFWLYGIMPVLKKIQEALNEKIVMPVDPTIYFEFNTKNVPAFQEDFFQKVDTADKLIKMGFPLNQVNEKLELGFDDVPWGDTHFVPFSSMPAEQALEGVKPGAGDDPEPEPDEDAEDDDTKSITSQVKKKDRTANFKYWTKFLQRQDPLEKKFTGALKSYFYDQRKRALEGLKGKSISNKATFAVSLDWDGEDDILAKKAKKHIQEALMTGVEFAESILASNINAEILQAKISSYLQLRVDLIKRINETNKKSITKLLQESLNDGSTIEDVSNKIRSVFNASSNRAKTIARTEMSGAMNGGQQLYYEESGVEQKMWVSSGDAVVRDTHAAMNGEIRRVKQSFSNGMEFPGGDGPAEEVINCRCVLSPYVE